MAVVVKANPNEEPRRNKLRTIVVELDTTEANKKLDELLEKANRLKEILAECTSSADKT